jgi:hypothetical protein
LAAAAAALTFGFIGTASALTVTKIADAPTAWQTAMNAQGNTTFVPGEWSVAPATRSGNSSGKWRSPFDKQDVGGNNNNSSYIGNSYFAVGPDNTTTEAVMTFTVDQTSLSFLWGSIDTYNRLSFYLNNALQGEVTNPAFGGNQTGRGASYVRISGVIFDEIRFGSKQNAFEFSNMSTTAVPIPAAAWLLGSGLFGLFAVGRRRRSAS